ncbi:MAG TPA: DUF2085 domain-containing protein [Bacteroidota bacterium]|nr:DUF2085 domain-containing protein [Bacteroidota bacterium]
MQSRPLIYAGLLFAAALWCALIIAAPVLAAWGVPAAADIYRFFRPVCHQDAARSFFLTGHPFAVCIRCTAVYAGFFAALIAAPFVPPVRPRSTLPFWLIGVSPMLIDVAADLTGLHEAGVLTRTFTGALFGLTAGFVLLPDAMNAIAGLFTPRIHEPRSTHE